MDYTQEQLASFKAEFARKRKAQFAIAIPFVAAMLGLILFEEQLNEVIATYPAWVPGAVFAVAAVAIGGFSWRNWRCPACDKYLGRSASMVHCPNCGVALK